MTEAKESQLIEEARKGNKESFEKLKALHKDKLLGFLRSVGVIDQDIEDVLQKIWELAWESLSKDPNEGGYDSRRADFYTWLTKCIAKYEAFTQVAAFHSNRLRVFLSTFGVPDQDIEDVMQQTWKTAWERLHQCPENGGYDPSKASLYTWLFKCIAKYEAMHWRDKKRQSLREPDRKAADDIVNINFFEETEEFRWNMLVYNEFFRITFLCGGYPHKQLAFGYAKLIHGKASNRGVETEPEKIDKKYGAEQLAELEKHFPASYKAAGGFISDQGIKDHLTPVRERLCQEIQNLILPPQEHLKVISNKRAADTCFRDYYGKEQQSDSRANHPISDWCYDVKSKVARVMGCKKGDSIQTKIEFIARQSQQGQIPRRGCKCQLPRVAQCYGDSDTEKP